MSTTQDIKVIRYGTQDGHQPTAQPLTSAVSVYGGTVAVTRAGYLINPDTAVQSTDYVWGVINGIVDSNPTVASPITGVASNLTVCGIDTGSFFLTPGTSADALTQADIGKTVYLINASTVGKTSNGGTRPVAGVLQAIGVAQYTGLVAVTLGSNQSTGSP